MYMFVHTYVYALWREFARQLKNVTLNDRLLWWRWSTKCDSHFQVDQLLAIDYVDVIDKTEMILSHSFATCLFRNKRTSLLKLLLCEKVNEEKKFMLPIFAKKREKKKQSDVLILWRSKKSWLHSTFDATLNIY